MKPCLIFDLDGTLVDSLPGIVASLNRTLAAHGLPQHSYAAIRALIGDGLRHLIEHAAPAHSDPALVDSLVTLYKKDYDLTWKDGTLVYPGVHAMLADFQQQEFPLAILSNKIHDFTVTMTRGIFPDIRFGMVLGQREGIPHKPQPDGALQIAATLGAAPQNCVFIGDSSIDLQTAANAGMPAVAVAWGYHDRQRLLDAGATRIIDHPSDLLALLGNQ